MFQIRDAGSLRRPRAPRFPQPKGALPLIAHVDMDAFFASVETRSDPRLRGRALVVGGGPEGRGVVTTASYTARPFGIHSGMSLAEARRLCPGILVIPVDATKYLHESVEVLRILDRFSPRVQAASIDEAYLEFPPVPAADWIAVARQVGERIRSRVEQERGLPCSVGLATVKVQAKMASGRAKPNGVLALTRDGFLRVFGPESVSKIPGVGAKTTEALGRLGIRTLHELARADSQRLQSVFGVGADHLVDQARGGDAAVVLAAGEEPFPRSASHETTFFSDVGDSRILRATVCLLADRVARRLRLYGCAARTVGVRFKVGLVRSSRQRVLERPTDDPVHLTRVAWDLLERERRGRALRLVGVVGMRLDPRPREAPLFPEDRNRRTAIRVGDQIRNRFGEGAIVPAETLRRRRGRS